MFCKYCGKELEEGTKFCPYCGKMQEESAVNDSVALQNGINPNTIQPSNKLDSSNSLFKASKVLLIISLVFLSLVSFLVIISTILSAGLTLLALIPFILALVFNSMGLSKLKKAKSVDEQTEAARILTWAKSRILNTQFQVNSLSIDRKDGILTYNTTTRDNSFGATLQYITAKIDKNKLVTIENLGIKKPILDISRDYNTLFTYFIMFGFTEFYARCTCSDYYSKYSKKRGIQNYFCSHILYSMAQFPWYASTYLAN